MDVPFGNDGGDAQPPSGGHTEDGSQRDEATRRSQSPPEATTISSPDLPSDDGIPMTPTQMAAASEDGDEEAGGRPVDAMSGGLQLNEVEPPLLPSQIMAVGEEDDKKAKMGGMGTAKGNLTLNELQPPPTESQMIAAVEEEDLKNVKKAGVSFQMTGNQDDAQLAKVREADRNDQPVSHPSQGDGGEISPGSPSTPASVNTDRLPRTSSHQREVATRPPPPSMLSPSNDVSARGGPALLEVEATLVPDEPEIPVYDAFPMDTTPWWKRHQRFICGGAILFVCAAVAVGVSLGPTRGKEAAIEEIPPVDYTNDPTLSPSRSPAPSTSISPSSPAPCLESEISIFTDERPNETSWTLTKIISSDVFQLVSKASPRNVTTRYTQELCLESGEYEFTISDSAGDGMCCASGYGNYSITIDGAPIAEGGEYGEEETVSFSVLPPTFQPSASLAPSESMPPTLQPSISLAPSIHTLKYRQRGPTIVADAGLSNFGNTVIMSADGKVMAIGAPLGIPLYVGSSYERGQVSVYEWDPDLLTYKQRGTPVEWNHLTPGRMLRSSVSLSADGQTLAIGTPEYTDMPNILDPGYVTVYKWNATLADYKQLGRVLEGDFFGDQFGESVCLSSDGSILAVGASQNNRRRSGYAMVYGWDEASFRYVQLGDTIEGDRYLGEFGLSMALSPDGKALAVSGIEAVFAGPGYVNVYRWEEASLNYAQLGDSIVGDYDSGFFGASVSISADGKTVAAGAPNGEGYAKVYRWVEASMTYEQLGDTIYGTAPGYHLGSSVSLSADGNTVAIGMYGNYENGFYSGQVDVHRWDETSMIFTQYGESLNGEAEGDEFGFSVSLSADGNTLLVGAPENAAGTVGGAPEIERNETIDKGHAKVFHFV